MKNKEFLCYQQFIENSKYINENNIMNGMRVAIRKVTAKDKEEAIEKFVKSTNSPKENALPIVCFELKSLASID